MKTNIELNKIGIDRLQKKYIIFIIFANFCIKVYFKKINNTHPAVVAWFVKAPVFHSVNSEPDRMCSI